MTFQYSSQVFCMAVRSAISADERPLVCTGGTLVWTGGTLVAALLVAVLLVAVGPVVPVELVDLTGLLIPVVAVVAGGATVATGELTVEETGSLLTGEATGVEATAVDCDDVASVVTIDPPGVSGKVEDGWPAPVEVQPATAATAANNSPNVALRRIAHPLASAYPDNTAENTGPGLHLRLSST